MTTEANAAQAATIKYLEVRAKHAMAMAEVSKLGREMGQAMNEMLAAQQAAGWLGDLQVAALRVSAKDKR